MHASADPRAHPPLRTLLVDCLTRYDDLGASSRVRFSQYAGALHQLAPGWHWRRQSLLDSHYLQRKYAGQSTWGATLRCYAARATAMARNPLPDLWWVEKELWPYAPAALERLLLSRRPYALDFDDAIFHNYDMHRLRVVRRLYGTKIDHLMAGAALVTAGNAYLADRARQAGARQVEIIPTVIDLERYPEPVARSRVDGAPVDIAWIGSPATVHYLQPLAGMLARLARRRPVRLVIIGGGAVQMPGVEVLSRPWAMATETAELTRCDIGIMPLPDTPWERGKCGYKLIQYMACGLPVVASAVGANREIVQPGVHGFLADDDAGWLDALEALVVDPALCTQLGRNGRRRAAEAYSVQAVAPRLVRALHRAAGQPA